MRIGIDMGHTLRGKGIGAVGIKAETALNRPLGNLVIDKLKKQGHTVVNCTVDEGNNSLGEICRKANSGNLDLFISIHFNCGGGNGVEVLTYDSKSTIANKYANNILKEITALGYRNRGLKYRPDLYVLNSTKCQALLVECAFLDSQKDMGMYNESSMAEAIVKGITGKSTVVENTNEYPIDTVIIINNTVDERAAKYLHDAFGWGILMIEQYQVGTARKVVTIGGSVGKLKADIEIAGSNRFNTCEKVIEYIKLNKK